MNITLNTSILETCPIQAGSIRALFDELVVKINQESEHTSTSQLNIFPSVFVATAAEQAASYAGAVFTNPSTDRSFAGIAIVVQDLFGSMNDAAGGVVMGQRLLIDNVIDPTRDGVVFGGAYAVNLQRQRNPNVGKKVAFAPILVEFELTPGASIEIGSEVARNTSVGAPENDPAAAIILARLQSRQVIFSGSTI